MERTMLEYAIDGWSDKVRRVMGAARAGAGGRIKKGADPDLERNSVLRRIESITVNAPHWVPKEKVEELRRELIGKAMAL